MDKPTIGRIVWFHDGHREKPAIVTGVQSEQELDLTVFDAGSPSGTYVRMGVMEGPGDVPKPGCWRWPERT